MTAKKHTLLILYALDVAKDNLFKECIVLSPDANVFLLLIYYYQLLPHLTIFKLVKEKLSTILTSKVAIKQLV